MAIAFLKSRCELLSETDRLMVIGRSIVHYDRLLYSVLLTQVLDMVYALRPGRIICRTSMAETRL
jgi:hypothetical protein